MSNIHEQQRVRRLGNFGDTLFDVLVFYFDMSLEQADLHLCCSHMAKTGFLMKWLIWDKTNCCLKFRKNKLINRFCFSENPSAAPSFLCLVRTL